MRRSLFSNLVAVNNRHLAYLVQKYLICVLSLVLYLERKWSHRPNERFLEARLIFFRNGEIWLSPSSLICQKICSDSRILRRIWSNYLFRQKAASAKTTNRIMPRNKTAQNRPDVYLETESIVKTRDSLFWTVWPNWPFDWQSIGRQSDFDWICN